MSATAPTISNLDVLAGLSDYARTDHEFWDALVMKTFKPASASWTGDFGTESPDRCHEEIAHTEVPPQDVYEHLESLLAVGREAFLREELEEQFADDVSAVIYEYGNGAISAIADFILGGRIRSDIASEILDLLGRIVDPITYRNRLWLLERALTSTDVKIRHGAALGIAYLRDLHASRYLQSAIESETCKELKRNLKQVLAYVESSR